MSGSAVRKASAGASSVAMRWHSSKGRMWICSDSQADNEQQRRKEGKRRRQQCGDELALQLRQDVDLQRQWNRQ